MLNNSYFFVTTTNLYIGVILLLRYDCLKVKHMVLITINIDENALKVVDEASKKDNRSRSNFMQFASEKLAKEVLSNDE